MGTDFWFGVAAGIAFVLPFWIVLVEVVRWLA